MKKIIAFDGPRGVGKDAIIRELLTRFPDRFKKIVTNSTRQPRAGEIHGVHHYFIDNKTFLEKVDSGEIFEHTQFWETYRGMSRSVVDSVIASGKIGVLTCDVVGVRALRRAYPDQVLVVFITADKGKIRARLLREHGTDIEERMLDYEKRHEFQNESDVIIENNGTLDAAVERVLTAIGETNGNRNRTFSK
jgi:guanylate kinase